MKKRIFSVLLAALTLISVLAMSSCYSLGGVLAGVGEDDYITKDELEEILKDYESDGTLNKYITEEQLNKILEQVNGNGDTFNIDITANGGESSAAAAKSVLSVVSVYSSFTRTINTGYYPTQQTKQEYSQAGSGVIYKLDKENGDAYIITNYHVVYSEYSDTEDGISDEISLRLYGQEYLDYAIPATYIGGSMNYDLAVLKVEDDWILKNSNARAADVANSNDISLLESVIAIGNPESLGISATAGYISVDSEYIQIAMTGLDGVQNVIQLRVMRVDAAVNSGNSGGGLFNSKGELVGIVNAKIADTSVENIGYAIPSNIAKAIAENIIYYHDKQAVPCVYRCLLGITVTQDDCHTVYDTETGKIYKKENALISELTDASFAKGKLQVGDIIKKVTIDGVEYEIDRMFAVIDSMLNARVGSVVKFDIERGGTAMDYTFTMDASTLSAVK